MQKASLVIKIIEVAHKLNSHNFEMVFWKVFDNISSKNVIQKLTYICKSVNFFFNAFI
jgi:hypothetical protein